LEWRSLLGRIEILLSKEPDQWNVILGPWCARSASGDQIPNKWTDARSEGIQALSSRYPWASKTDQELFLEGFDAGAQFALGIQHCDRQAPEYLEKNPRPSMLERRGVVK
jgi:hypothetical protein